MLDQTILKNPLLMKSANLIDGEWIAAGADAIPVTNPATSVLLGSVPNSGRKETKRAVEAASRAFPAWRAKTAAERAAILRRLHALILEHQDDLAELLTIEQGKSLAEAKGEVGDLAPPMCCGSPRKARRTYGDVVPSPWADRRILVTKEPVGVVAAITPWNFPSSMLARKIGPALAAGCTAVIKPASQTPYSGLAWGVLCEEVGFPKGVVNVVTGSARRDRRRDLLEPAGQEDHLHRLDRGRQDADGASAATTVKKVSMELGGNAPFIVFDDADLDRAVEGAMVAKYRNSGQTCVCTNRFLVQDGIYDAFVEKLAAAAGKLKVGTGLEDGVQQGPLIDDKAVDKVEELIADARPRAARSSPAASAMRSAARSSSRR